MSRKNGGRTNLNHNIWNNNGTWWVHHTVYPTRFTKERVRCSLKTKSVKEARCKRDALLHRVRIQELRTRELAEMALAA